MRIIEDDLSGSEISSLLEEHFAGMLANSPKDSCHFLDLEGLKGPGVTLQVIAPFRGLGLGRTLLERLAARAVEHGAEAIYATQKVDADSEAMRAWSAFGLFAAER